MSAQADDGLLSLSWREVVQLREYPWEDVTRSFLSWKGAVKKSIADEMKLVHYEELSQKGDNDGQGSLVKRNLEGSMEH